MSENILQKIIDQKKIKIEKLKCEIDIDSLIETINETMAKLLSYLFSCSYPG